MNPKNCLSFWFPYLLAADLPVPRTEIVRMDQPAMAAAYNLVFDSVDPGDKLDAFFAELTAAANRIGYPCFLRSGQTSGKHNWKNTCYLAEQAYIRRQVFNIIEYGEMASFMGLPFDVWAVRELLPVKPIGVCEGYGGMPVVREFRCFVDGGELECVHCYWPLESLSEGGFTADVAEGWYERFSDPGRGRSAIETLATRAGSILGGRWSVDCLQTERGWFITDLAVAEESWHWPGCVNAPKPKERTIIKRKEMSDEQD